MEDIIPMEDIKITQSKFINEPKISLNSNLAKIQLQKRGIFQCSKDPNIIYVSRKRPPIVYYKKIRKRILSGQTQVVLKAIGAAIKEAVDISLKIQRDLAEISLNVETGTIELIDDFVDEYGNVCLIRKF